MEIKEIIKESFEKYENIAINDGTIFNSLSWLKIFGEKVKVYGIYDKGKNLIGGFHLFKEKRFGINYYRNPPITPIIGPFLYVKAQTPCTIMQKWKDTIDLMTTFFEKLPFSILYVSFDKKVIDTQPLIWKKYKVIPGYTYVIDLEKPVEELRKNMCTKRRQNINKAFREGLTLRLNDDLRIVKSLVLKTFLRQNKKVDTFYLDNVLFQFANKDNSFSFVSYQDKKPSAAGFFVYDKKTVYYILGGYDEENSHAGAVSSIIWEAIQLSKKLGIKYFDFEGSMIPHIERFFRGFGGILTPYYRVSKAAMPLEILLKFYRRELF